MNESFKTIGVKKTNLICELLKEIWMSDIFIPKLGSRIFFVIFELCLWIHINQSVFQFVEAPRVEGLPELLNSQKSF